MSVDQRLHDAAPTETATRRHAARLREDVVSQFVDAPQAPRRRSRLLKGALSGGAVAALLGVGGIAYASGVIPDMFRDTIIGANPQDAPSMTQIVDLPLPGGGRFAAWRGQSDSQFCTASTDGWDNDQAEDAMLGSLVCVDATTDEIDLNRVQVTWSAGAERDPEGHPEIWYPVLFGDTDADATMVRVTGTVGGTGEAVDLTAPLDPASKAFGLVLPGSSANPWAALEPDDRGTSGELEVTFIDSDGQAVATAKGAGL